MENGILNYSFDKNVSVNSLSMDDHINNFNGTCNESHILKKCHSNSITIIDDEPILNEKYIIENIQKKKT